MSRETYRICITGMSPVERMKVIDVIGASLVKDYHKNVAFVQEGHISDAAIDAIPTSVKVFIVCSENHHEAKNDQPAPVHMGEVIDDNAIDINQIEGNE